MLYCVAQEHNSIAFMKLFRVLGQCTDEFLMQDSNSDVVKGLRKFVGLFVAGFFGFGGSLGLRNGLVGVLFCWGGVRICPVVRIFCWVLAMST